MLSRPNEPRRLLLIYSSVSTDLVTQQAGRAFKPWKRPRARPRGALTFKPCATAHLTAASDEPPLAHADPRVAAMAQPRLKLGPILWSGSDDASIRPSHSSFQSVIWLNVGCRHFRSAPSTPSFEFLCFETLTGEYVALVEVSAGISSFSGIGLELKLGPRLLVVRAQLQHFVGIREASRRCVRVRVCVCVCVQTCRLFEVCRLNPCAM